MAGQIAEANDIRARAGQQRADSTSKSAQDARKQEATERERATAELHLYDGRRTAEGALTALHWNALDAVFDQVGLY